MRNVFNFFLFYSLIAVKSTYAQLSNTPEDISHPPIYTTIDDLTSETIKEPGLINFVREWTALAPINNQFEFTNSSATSVNQKTSYFDGLGRQIQIVVKEGSQNFKDLVFPQIYDNYGREIYKVLSYQASGSSGNFYSSPLSEQSSFLQSKYPYEQVFYSKTEYEPSPLNRINKTYAPGNSWAGSGRGISYKYLISTEADAVRVWNVENNIPVSPSAYLPGELYKNVTIDEAGNAVVEYKDKDGLVILKKVQAEDNTPADYSGYDKWLCTYYIYDDLGRLCFVLSPKAVKMLYEAPQIWEVNSNNLEILNELCFQNKYDSRSRLKAKKVPGADWVYMAYDSRDRLVFTQDGNMRLRNQWLSNLYDNLNRVVITGMTNYSGSFEDLQTYINTPRGSNSYNSEGTSISATVSISTLQSGLIHIQAAEIITFDPGFTTDNSTSLIAEIITGTSESIDISEDPFPPNSTFIPLTITYYDNYPSQNLFNPANNTKLDAGNNLHPVTLPQQSEQKVIGMVTGNKIRILSDPENLSQGGWLESYIYYDKYGRVLQTNSKNNIGGRDEITNMYDFSGKLLCSYLLHTTANPNEETGIATSMEYDHTGALIKVSKRINGGENKLILENEYNELGQLAKKKLGKNPSGNDPLETLNYNYNIRGWLKGINSGYVKGSDNNNWFGMDLSYDWGFTLNQYNGNISGTKWRSKGDGEQRSYGFGYDNVNRLMFADFNQYSDGGWNKSAGVDFTTIMGNGINHSTAYDENGNIKGMKQWGLKLTSSSLIDDLSYNYMPNSNKLLNVIDNSNDPHTKLGDFRSSVLYQQSEPVKTNTTIDYEYDINGNLTKDLNKDIFSSSGNGILYNHLNLPYKINVQKDANSQKGEIKYIYDAMGSKLQKITEEKDITISHNGSSYTTDVTTTTDYSGVFVYESKSYSNQDLSDLSYSKKLQFFSHEEGRVRPLEGNTEIPFVYDYFIKDHLGNVRMVLTEEEKQDKYPVASLEDSKIEIEKSYYDINSSNVADKSEAIGITDYVNDNGIGTNPEDETFSQSRNAKLYKLNSNTAKTGLGITLKVMAGDRIDVFGKSYYFENTSGTGSNSPITVLDLLNSFLNTPAAAGTTHGITGPDLNNSVNLPGINGMISQQSSQSNAAPNKPRAFINVIFFDEQFKSYNFKLSMAGEAGIIKEHFSELQNIAAAKNGYVYIYCSNESPVNVFFDNLQVVHTRGALLEETHYYPFGLTMAGINSKAAGSLENKRKWNVGSELNTDFDINLYETFYRSLDPQIGRFWQVDPKPTEGESPYVSMGNNPISNVDPKGDYFFGLFGSTSEQRKAARALAAETGGEIHNITKKSISVSYVVTDATTGAAVVGKTGFYEHGFPTILGKQAYNKFLNERAARLYGTPASGRVEMVDDPITTLGPSLVRGLLTKILSATILKSTSLEVVEDVAGAESKWVFGAFKSEAKWASQLAKRGWTPEQITEAITNGEKVAAQNLVNPANGATRYISPTTGQSVVVDNVTKEVLHVGGPGFKY